MIFPGMDPYLENPVIFPGIHSRMVVYLADQIAPRIRPRYAASVGERVYVESAKEMNAHPIIPDVWVRQTIGHSGQSGGVAVEELPEVDEPIVMEAQDLEIRQPFIEILDRESNMRVVTVIELVSPSNKYAGAGRDSYITKQREVLCSDPDVRLNIRAALEQAYDAGSYDQRIDYSRRCFPPLTAEVQMWVGQLVEQAKPKPTV